MTELDLPPNPVSPRWQPRVAGWSHRALRFAGTRWGRRVSVIGLVVLLLVYLLLAAVGAVRPGLVWLTILAGVLFLLTVVGGLLVASAVATASGRPPS